MGEFFRGWRRKAGLATLAMALLLMAGWMRSYVVHDEVFIPRQHSHDYVGSICGGLYWERTLHGSLTPEDWFGCESPAMEWVSDEVTLSPADRPAGFHHGADNGRGWWTIPHWSLVLPLTLASAWLILIKPRPAKSVGKATP